MRLALIPQGFTARGCYLHYVPTNWLPQKDSHRHFAGFKPVFSALEYWSERSAIRTCARLFPIPRDASLSTLWRNKMAAGGGFAPP